MSEDRGSDFQPCSYYYDTINGDHRAKGVG